MTKFKCNLTLEDATDIQFTNLAGANTGKIEADGDDLVISNAIGDVLLGDGASDVYIGDGTNNVDILFEQSGSIKAEDGSSGVTLTLGSGDTTLALGSAISSATTILGDLTVGVDDTGHDVTFFGATSSKKMLWDQSADTLVVDGTLDINGNADISGTVSGNFVVRSTNNSNTDGANFAVDTTNKSVSEYAYEVLRSGTTVAGITIAGKVEGTEIEGTSLDINGDADISGALTLGTALADAEIASAATWNTAYGWGDHGLSAQDKTDIGNLSGTNTGDQTTVTGNAGTATKLAATKTIAGVAFDGSANISLNNNAITNGAGYTTYAGPADGVEGTKGIVELASIEEAIIGSDTAKAITAAGVSAHVVGRKVHELTAPTAALAMNAQKITGVADPAAAQDAATKAYTDAKVWDGSDITSGTIAAARVATLNQNTTGLAGTATALATTRAIYGNNFDGSAAVTGTIATTYIADDAVTFAKASGVSPNIYGSIIKLLPSDFATNIDGGNTKFGVGYTDTAGSAYGMKVGSADTELFAFVSIPEGMKATHVDVFDKDSRALEVFEVQINATSLTSKGSGSCNTTLDITDVNATATNFLAIKITTTATTDKVFGGQVTIAAI
jgi:hypothetical protein